jgi:hypothetical protein
VAGSYTGALFRSDNQARLTVAVLNLESSTATIQWSAVDDSGREVASGKQTLGAGVKVAASLETLLGAAVNSAVLVRYSSDKKLAGCALKSSADGTLLEGLTALREYMP